MKGDTRKEEFAPRYLVLFVTTACNLQCPYCYADDLRAKKPMPWEVAEAALNRVAHGGFPFHVQLTGGEPTLEPVLVEKIASWLRSRRLPAKVALQTNGTCLDEGLVRILQEREVQIGVSIDGSPSVHDRIRGGVVGTLKGLDLLSRMGVPFRTTTVVTQRNAAVLDQPALMLARYPNLQGMALDLPVRKGRMISRGEALCCDPESLAAGVAKLVKTIDRLNGTRRHPISLREWERLRSSRREAAPTDYCHACRGESMAVLPDGSVYPCSQTAGDPALQSGRIDRWESVRPRMLGRRSLREVAGEDCRTCIAEPFCPDDCPSRLRYNDPPTIKSACVLYRTIVSLRAGGRDDGEAWTSKDGSFRRAALDKGDG